MRDLSNSRHRSSSDAVVIFHPPRLPPPSNLWIHSQQRQNICGPVSYSRPKYLDLLRLTKKDEKNLPKAQSSEKEDEKGHHMFLMDDLKNLVEMPSEHEKADRAVFAQNLMLSLLQNEKFQP